MSVWLVCGGRNFDDWPLVEEVLDRIAGTIGPPSLVVGGGATGADALGMRWAYQRRIMRRVFVANWRGDGKLAGMLRNQKMLDEGRPDLVVAFPGGAGTADMLRRARNEGVRFLEVGTNGYED